MADTIITATVATGSLYQTGGTGNVYYFNGSRPTTDPSSTNYKFPFVAGATLRIEQSDSTNNGHPFLFTNSNSTNTNTMRAGIITNNIDYFLDGAVSQSDYMNTGTFNAATQRYIEITQTAGDVTDFYFACWIHGIGMGGIIDLTQTTWGGLTWGQGKWNKQGDQAVTISTSLLATGVLNPAVDVEQFPGWGTLAWGENSWGNVEGAVEVLPSFLVTGGLGSLTAETFQSVSLTGFEMTGGLGTPVTKFDFALSLTDSLLTNGVLGQLGINAGDNVQIGLTTLLATGSVGAITPIDNTNILIPSFVMEAKLGQILNETAVLVSIGTSLLATGSVGAITPINNTGVSITTSLLATGVLNPAVTVPTTVVGLTGLEITGILDAVNIYASGYADVDIDGSVSYTDVKHVNQA